MDGLELLNLLSPPSKCTTTPGLALAFVHAFSATRSRLWTVSAEACCQSPSPRTTVPEQQVQFRFATPIYGPSELCTLSKVKAGMSKPQLRGRTRPHAQRAVMRECPQIPVSACFPRLHSQLQQEQHRQSPDGLGPMEPVSSHTVPRARVLLSPTVNLNRGCLNHIALNDYPPALTENSMQTSNEWNKATTTHDR